MIYLVMPYKIATMSASS